MNSRNQLNDLEPTEQDELIWTNLLLQEFVLGIILKKVENILGEDYEEIYEESYMASPLILRDYDDGGISFTIGKDSNKVLEIDSLQINTKLGWVIRSRLQLMKC